MHVDTWSQKLKADQKFFWVCMVKIRFGQSGHGAQKWIDGIKSFFSCWYEFREAKSWFNYFWVDVVKNGIGVHETLICVARMNIWIKQIFWMVIVIKYFLLGLISYYLTYSTLQTVGVHCSCTSSFELKESLAGEIISIWLVFNRMRLFEIALILLLPT